MSVADVVVVVPSGRFLLISASLELLLNLDDSTLLWRANEGDLDDRSNSSLVRQLTSCLLLFFRHKSVGE